MSQSIPIKSFLAEDFAVEVRRRPNQKHRGKCPRMTRIKTGCCLLVIVPALVSCASAPLTLGAVGPGHLGRLVSDKGRGELQVYTETEEYYADQSSYFPHTDYQLYTSDGKHLRRVWNHTTHEDESPAIVSLPPGRYVVQAWAEFYGLVSVPVVIKSNELTKVILQPGWNPGNDVARSDLVQMPQGYFVGWRAEEVVVR